jgi:molybdate transport system substrate-binding protein
MGAHREALRRETRPVKLRLVSAGAAQGLVAQVAGELGVEVEGSFGAVGAMLDRFEAGEACDVVILTRRQIDALEAAGRVQRESARDLGRVPTAIAVLAGAPHPDVSTGAALHAALLGADGIYFPDPAKATAGIHFAGVLDALGIREAVAGRIRNFPNGATSMRAMATAGGRPIGCTQASEILATPGIELVAALPPGHDLATMYTAAASARARDAKAAAAFVDALADPALARRRASAGFQAASPAA